MKRHALLLGLFVLVASALHHPVGLGFGAPAFPAVIPLPVGFGPEGIAAGNGTTFYVGSLAPATFGQILVGDLRTNVKHLIVVHTSEGRLYRIDTATYSVVPIDLGTGDVCSADGLLLDGRTLYVVQNALNRIAVVELVPDHLSGTITRYITEPFASNAAIKVPTTIAEFGDALYAVTAGFAPPAPDFVVRLPK